MTKLIAPDGTEYEPADAVEANNLRYGHGYRPADTDPSPATGTGTQTAMGGSTSLAVSSTGVPTRRPTQTDPDATGTVNDG